MNDEGERADLLNSASTTVWLPCANLHNRRPLAQRDEAFFLSPCKILLVPPRQFLLQAGLSFFGKAGRPSSLDTFGRP